MVPLEEITDISSVVGVLLSLRHLLVHLIDVQSSDGAPRMMKGSFGAKFSEADVKLDVRQMIKVSIHGF